MSLEKRPQSYFNTEFTNQMQGDFAPRERARLGSEIGGFKGEIGIKIAELQEQGLGRVIGVPYNNGSTRSGGVYQEVMYALPHADKTETGHEQEILLLIPHQNGFDQFLVTPQKAITGRMDDNEKIQSEFDKIFSPSDSGEPFLFTGGWNLTSLERPARTFVNRLSRFFADYRPVPNSATLGEAYEDSVAIAIQRKKQMEDNVIELRQIYNRSSEEKDAA